MKSTKNTVIANTLDTHRVAVAIQDESGKWYVGCEPVVAWNVYTEKSGDDSHGSVTHVAAITAAGSDALETEDTHLKDGRCAPCVTDSPVCPSARYQLDLAKRR